MKDFTAIILASGIGKRLRPLTDSLPKSLIEIGGRSLLERQLDSLTPQGCSHIIITTGHCGDKIKQFVEDNYHNYQIELVYNSKYEITNYIYSLWLIKSNLKQNVILLHGDLVYENEVLKGLVDSPLENAVIVSHDAKKLNKDFKAVVEDGKISRIGVQYSGPNTFSCLPLYKLSLKFISTWQARIDEFISDNKVSCYAEDALNTLMPGLGLCPFYIRNKFCMEIDTYEDLEIASSHPESRNFMLEY